MFLSSVLYDIGLAEHGRGPHRFEIDGAIAARTFLVEKRRRACASAGRGSDAYAAAEKNDLARLEEARIWKKLSVSTDFETK
jgi:hypothetical protein